MFGGFWRRRSWPPVPRGNDVAEVEGGSPRRLLLTVDAAASALGIGRSHLYRYVQTGELRSIKIGRSRRIPVAALEKFIEQLQTEQAENEAG